MALARITSNTSKEYPCTMCGADGNIIREDARNPRVKCNSCGFTYDGEDSLAARAAGQIPDGPPDIPVEEPIQDESSRSIDTPIDNSHVDPSDHHHVNIDLPRSPTHVLLAKDRASFTFVTKRTLRKEVLKWTAGSKAFDLFELTLKKVDARIEID